MKILIWSAVAEQSGDTAFGEPVSRATVEIQARRKRRRALLAAAIQNLSSTRRSF
jgi:hypothetical protein